MAQLEYSVEEWFRDAQGFRLEKDPPVPLGKPNFSFDGGAVSFPAAFSRAVPFKRNGDLLGWRIIRNGGSLVPYQPSNNLNEILFELLNTPPTAKGALDFVNRFGPMGRAGFEEWGESVLDVINDINYMNGVIEVWPTHGDNTPIGQILGPDGFGLLGVVGTRIIYDQPKKTPRIHITFQNLGTLLWAHLFELLTSKDTVLRRCAQCNDLFLAGAGTGRRLDAKFCRDEHRALFHNSRRSSKAT